MNPATVPPAPGRDAPLRSLGGPPAPPGAVWPAPPTPPRHTRRGHLETAITCAAFALILVAGAAGAAPEVAAVRLFFAAVIGGGLIAAARLAGTTAQATVALSLLVLTLLQRWDVRTVDAPPDSLWITALERPDQIVQHTIALPLGRPEWDALWRPGAAAAAWVCARGPLTPDDALQLSLNGELLATITEAHSSAPRPLPASVGFFRVPIDRARLERRPHAVFQLRRGPGATERPIDICGTFAYRPTAGLESSAYFDGTQWLSPGATRRGRFTIELRFEDAAKRVYRALY